MARNGIRKHSLTISGHRTSVSLEDEFWTAFREIAAAEALSTNELAARIDAKRSISTGLASAIRVFVLVWFRQQGGDRRPQPTAAIHGASSSIQ